MLVNSQLICLPPLGFSSLLCLVDIFVSFSLGFVCELAKCNIVHYKHNIWTFWTVFDCYVSQTDRRLQFWCTSLWALHKPNTQSWWKRATNCIDVEQKSARFDRAVHCKGPLQALYNEWRHYCVRADDHVTSYNDVTMVNRWISSNLDELLSYSNTDTVTLLILLNPLNNGVPVNRE